MARLNLRSFAQPDLLKGLQAANLLNLLEPYRMFFEMKGLEIPTNLTDPIDVRSLAAVLAQPDEDMPGELVEALHLISSLGSEERFDDLLVLADANEIEVDSEVTPLDLATQVWLKNPEALERKEQERSFEKRRTFESFMAVDPDTAVEVDQLPADLTPLEQSLEAYFSAKKRGVGCRITRMDGPGEARFLVEHGQPCKREPSRKGRRSTTTFFRPEKTDIVIYDAVHNELRINAASLPDMREYRKLFSLHLFGSEDCFVLSDKYTLTPLQTDGIDALNCRDIPGMERVDLCEIEYAWPGPFQHRETIRSANLFSSLAVLNREIERDALIVKAVFKIKWEGQRKLQTVTIKAGNKSGYTRGEESMIVEDWLRARGFIVTRERIEDEALEADLAIA